MFGLKTAKGSYIKRTRTPLTGLALSLAGVFAASGVAQAASFEGAYAYVDRGGTGSTLAITSPSVGGLEIRGYVLQMSGGSQDVGARLSLYSEPHGQWLHYDWKTTTTSSLGLRTGPKVWFTDTFKGLPKGRYYIRMDYAWLTTAGWVTRLDYDLGWVTL